MGGGQRKRIPCSCREPTESVASRLCGIGTAFVCRGILYKEEFGRDEALQTSDTAAGLRSISLSEFIVCN